MAKQYLLPSFNEQLSARVCYDLDDSVPNYFGESMKTVEKILCKYGIRITGSMPVEGLGLPLVTIDGPDFSRPCEGIKGPHGLKRFISDFGLTPVAPCS